MVKIEKEERRGLKIKKIRKVQSCCHAHPKLVTNSVECQVWKTTNRTVWMKYQIQVVSIFLMISYAHLSGLVVEWEKRRGGSEAPNLPQESRVGVQEPLWALISILESSYEFQRWSTHPSIIKNLRHTQELTLLNFQLSVFARREIHFHSINIID